LFDNELLVVVKNTIEKIDYTNKCPECGNSNLTKDYQRAELVCKQCGLVVREEIADLGPKWRAFDQEQRDKRAHTGPPTKYTIYDKGLSTTISWKNHDAYGRSIPTKQRGQLYRMRKWQHRTIISNASERNLIRAFAELSKLSSQMNLPRSIRERAGMISRKAAKKNLIRGLCIEAIVVATIYAACRLAGMPRTLDELSNISGIPRRDIGRTYRFIVRELKLKMNIPTPLTYIPRFCNKLKVNHKVKTKAEEILTQSFEKELIIGRGPVSVAAAAIYIATVLCDGKRTQREVADVAGVTEVTIRNRYKEIVERLDINFEL
jgi:transcription initiation factor TFIIB